MNCILNGVPSQVKELPSNVVFVGMEKSPNQPARYGKVWHPWHNLPCYETRDA